MKHFSVSVWQNRLRPSSIRSEFLASSSFSLESPFSREFSQQYSCPKPKDFRSKRFVKSIIGNVPRKTWSSSKPSTPKTNSTKSNGKEREEEGEQLASLFEQIIKKIKIYIFLNIWLQFQFINQFLIQSLQTFANLKLLDRTQRIELIR